MGDTGMTTPTTNVEAWHAVRDLRADGLTNGQIAARLDLSRQMVRNWLHVPKPPAARPLGRTRGASARAAPRLCERCGESALRNPDPASRNLGRWCGPCYRVIAQERAAAPVKVARLTGWAYEHHRVPTVNEAADVLGMSRSRAGDLVKLAFGPDPLSGGARKKRGPRPWPPTRAR